MKQITKAHFVNIHMLMKILKPSFSLFVCVILLFTIFVSYVSAQDTLTQNIRGTVVDGLSKSPIENVNIIIPALTGKGTTTDKNGYFILQNVPVGRYDIRFSHIGYTTQVKKDVLIEAGKEAILSINMTTTSNVLEDVEIASGTLQNPDFVKSNAYSFNMEQSQRFAATFYDPGRMALSLPGVTSANDQANNISIRGNTPANMTWRLEGADIVNPNHLTNAGTFSDRPSVVGGGVNILSAQLMEKTTLYNGAFPAKYGNALSGVMDIRLRNGNRDNHEYTMQAGLLGMDIAAEGPFSSDGNASYLANYRYSTIGLLTALGVEVSDEEINFQDLSFKVNIPTKKAGEFSIFGMGGLSNEKFKAERDSSTWETEEDRLDTDFSSEMGAIGASHFISLNKISSLHSIVSLSTITSERTGIYVSDQNFLPTTMQEDAYSQGMLSLSTHFNHKINNNQSLKSGIYINHMFYDILSRVKYDPAASLNLVMNGSGNFQILKPYLSYSMQLSDKLKTSLGLHNQYVSINNEYSPEPRISIEYALSNQTHLALNYGLVSQTQIPHVYFVTAESNSNNGTYPNKDLKLTKSHQLVATLSTNITQNIDLKFEAYYQHHYDVPVTSATSGTFSILNASDAFIDRTLVNQGTGDNMGVDVAVNRHFRNGFYFLAGGSVYDSKYTAADDVKRDTRFNGNYQITFTGGKEIMTVKNDKNRVFGINTHVIWQGGYQHTPINLQASREAGRTIFREEQAFTEKLKDYGRLDLRIYFKRHKENYTRTLSLDIQNVTNRENVAYKYYDIHVDKVVTKKQLGFLPFINYRLEF